MICNTLRLIFLLDPRHAVLAGDGPGHGRQPGPGLAGRGRNLRLRQEEPPGPGVPQLQPEGVLDPGLLVGPVHARPGRNVDGLKGNGAIKYNSYMCT